MIIRKIQVISIYIRISFVNCNHPSYSRRYHPSLGMLHLCEKMDRHTFNYFLTHHRDLSFHSFYQVQTHLNENLRPLGMHSQQFLL